MTTGILVYSMVFPNKEDYDYWYRPNITQNMFTFLHSFVLSTVNLDCRYFQTPGHNCSYKSLTKRSIFPKKLLFVIPIKKRINIVKTISPVYKEHLNQFNKYLENRNIEVIKYTQDFDGRTDVILNFYIKELEKKVINDAGQIRTHV